MLERAAHEAQAIRAKAEKDAAARKAKRADQWAIFKMRAAAFARHAMVVGPIIAPMTVAWTGQSGFATSVLGWNFLASLLYAAAYELTTIFSAYMYHEAKRDGDKGWEYRIATWVFAAGAGVQQWWHYSNDWQATPRSVTYSTMTAIGVVVWELYARLIHRRSLRADGKLPAARPRIGLVRWVRYPRISFTAWSGSVRYGFEGFDDTWTWGEASKNALLDIAAGTNSGRPIMASQPQHASLTASRVRAEALQSTTRSWPSTIAASKRAW